MFFSWWSLGGGLYGAIAWLCCLGGVLIGMQILLLSLWAEIISARLIRSVTDYSFFYCHTSDSQCIYLVVYVDDIVITESDQDGIFQLKTHLYNRF